MSNDESDVPESEERREGGNPLPIKPAQSEEEPSSLDPQPKTFGWVKWLVLAGVIGVILVGVANFFPRKAEPEDWSAFLVSDDRTPPPSALTYSQKQWRMDRRKDDVSCIKILASGYKFLKAYRAPAFINQEGKKIGARDITDWGWRVSIKNEDPQKTYCVEVQYLLEDARGVRVAASLTGIRIKPLESKTVQKMAVMPYSKLPYVVKADWRIRATANFFTPFFCSGATFNQKDEQTFAY